MREGLWPILRFTLGMTQMATATVALILLLWTGVSRWSLAAAVAACASTTVSVLLFGSRSPNIHDPSRSSEK